jgi:hypothetical protein
MPQDAPERLEGGAGAVFSSQDLPRVVTVRDINDHLCGAAASMTEILDWMKMTRKMNAAVSAH